MAILYFCYRDPSESYDGSGGDHLQNTDGTDIESFDSSFTFTLPVRPVIDSASYDETNKHIKLEFTGDDIAGFNRDELRKASRSTKMLSAKTPSQVLQSPTTSLPMVGS